MISRTTSPISSVATPSSATWLLVLSATVRASLATWAACAALLAISPIAAFISSAPAATDCTPWLTVWVASEAVPDLPETCAASAPSWIVVWLSRSAAARTWSADPAMPRTVPATLSTNLLNACASSPASSSRSTSARWVRSPSPSAIWAIRSRSRSIGRTSERASSSAITAATRTAASVIHMLVCWAETASARIVAVGTVTISDQVSVVPRVTGAAICTRSSSPESTRCAAAPEEAAFAASSATPESAALPACALSPPATSRPPVLTSIADPVPNGLIASTIGARPSSCMSIPATPTAVPPRRTGTTIDVISTSLPPT